MPVLAVALHRLGSDPYRVRPGRKHIVVYKPHTKRLQQGAYGGHHPLLWSIVLGAAVVLFLAALGYAVVRLRSELARRPSPPPGDPAADARLLADALESGRRALSDGTDARTAVIACYVAMEASLAGSGVARKISDSPRDLLERVAGSGLPTGDSASVLTELFREARYSTHPMGDAHRDRAAAALGDLADRLGVPRAAAAAPGAAS